MPVEETAAKPESKVSLASGCRWPLVGLDRKFRCHHHINDFASFQEPKDAAAAARGHDDDAKLVPVETTTAKPELKVSLASAGCRWLVGIVGS